VQGKDKGFEGTAGNAGVRAWFDVVHERRFPVGN